jgi:hypothetical protein
MAKFQTSRVDPSTRGDRRLKVRKFAKVLDHGPCPWHLTAAIRVRGHCRIEEFQKAVLHRGETGWALEDSMAFEEFAQDSGVRCMSVRGPLGDDSDPEIVRDGTLIAGGVDAETGETIASFPGESIGPSSDGRTTVVLRHESNLMETVNLEEIVRRWIRGGEFY